VHLHVYPLKSLYHRDSCHRGWLSYVR
jgi:hypothetical protein